MVPLEPRHDERRISAAVAVSQSEAVLAVELLGAAPADQRDVQLVGQRSDGDRVVGAVGAGDPDAPLVNQPSEAVGGVLGRALGKAVLGMQDELDRAAQEPLLGGLVEGHPVNLVVPAPGSVQRRTQPADLYRVHGRSPLSGPYARTRFSFFQVDVGVLLVGKVGYSSTKSPTVSPRASRCLSTLPEALWGRAGTISICSGTLNAASARPQNERISWASATEPSLRTTKALTCWPNVGCATPITAASATDACSYRRFSISAGETFSPPRMMRSSRRPAR